MRPIYQKTAENGHFGHEVFPWEQPKTLSVSIEVLQKMKVYPYINQNICL